MVIAFAEILTNFRCAPSRRTAPIRAPGSCAPCSAVPTINRLGEALEAGAEIQHIEPNHVVARGWRSVVLIALGRSQEALAELDQGIALDPSGPDIAFILRQKCKAYSFLGQYEKAIPTCEKVSD